VNSAETANSTEAVAAGSRQLAAEGLLIGTAGNVSMRTGDQIAVTATGVTLAAAGPEHVTVVDLDGTSAAGDLAPTSELLLHLGIYRRFGAGAVVHTHSPMATALTLVADELPCVHYQLLPLGGAIRVAPFAVFGTTELAERVLTALDGKTAALMANHGAVTFAPTLDQAVEQALVLEWACGLYLRAAAVGAPRTLSTEQQHAVIAAALARGYGTTRRVDDEESQ
jgi:L-fuculose-phosphate aldolase